MDQEKGVKLSLVNVSFLYVGALMGAGFASGKEMWQFFGVFGGSGIFGILLITLIFMGFGYMTIYIAQKLQTSDISKLIFPMDNKALENIIGVLMSVFLLMGYFSMLAAGNAILEEQFGINRIAGGVVLMLLVAFTAINGFDVVSKRLQKVTPVLLAGTLILCLIIVFRDFDNLSKDVVIAASPLASNWFVASIVFVSYNLMAGIPMLGSCALHVENRSTGLKGAALGGLFLGICAVILYGATLTDPGLSAESALPMLGLCRKIAPAVQLIYAVVLLIAVFGTATSLFYGFTTKVPDRKHSKFFIWTVAVAGFCLSLIGFSNIVAFLYPIEGYCGMFFLACMAVNFIRVCTGKRSVDLDASDQTDRI